MKQYFLIIFILILTKSYCQDDETLRYVELIQKGFELLDNQNYTEANEKFQEALIIEEKSQEALIGLMHSYILTEDYGNIVPEFLKYDDFFIKEKYRARYYYSLGISYGFLNKLEEGMQYINKYGEIVNDESISEMDFFLLAKLFLAYDLNEHALNNLESHYNLFKHAKREIPSIVLHSEILFKLGEFDKALEKVNELFSLDKSKDKEVAEVLLSFSNFLLNQEKTEYLKDFNEEVLSSRFKKYLQQNDVAYLEFLIGYAYLKQNEPEKADKQLSAIKINDFNDDFIPVFYYTILLESTGYPKFFEKYLKEAQAKFPNEFIFFFLEGQFFEKQNFDKDFVKDLYLKSLQKEVRAFTKKHKTPLILIDEYFISEFYDINQTYKFIKEADFVNEAHIIKYAEIAFFKDNYRLANNFFDLAIENSNDNNKNKSKIKNYQSITYLKHSDFDRSLSFIEEAYEYYPDNFFKLIKSYIEIFEVAQNNRTEQKHFQKLLESNKDLDSGSRAAKSYLKALALFNLGEKEEACKEIMLEADKLKEINVRVNLFCNTNSTFPSLFQESLRMFDLFIIE